MKTSSMMLGLLGLSHSVVGDPTWPSSIDELEEIMYQINSFRSRKFADTVNPCNRQSSQPGRLGAAEWLRSAFHDMSTANTVFKTGGMDGSLQYELENGENTGTGHRTTLRFMDAYVSTRSSLSDLLAMGVYMSVRSCGGPIVPIRAGRKDATEAGSLGVPQPQNSVTTFQQQFERMGFNTQEMIELTACGHTLGGVHSMEFPELMPATVVNGNVPLDTSEAAFDNNVVTEYLSGKTTNPLVVYPSNKINKHSDFKVFNADGNVTMKALADANNFKTVCQKVLQKMIEVVPPSVTLTEPIAPYTVKPVNLQLTLADKGASLRFTGYIRVKTTGLAQNSIKSISLKYKDRKGTSNCGSGSCTITATVQGVSQGFDDTFNFYPIDAVVPAATGISSFTVTVNNADGSSKLYDNNGKGYPLQDDILFQAPQSCVLGSSGALTVVAAVRNDIVSQGAQASISYKMPQDTSPLGILNSATIPLKKGACIGKYTLFSADYTIPGESPYQTRVDVITGNKSDSFKAVADLGGTCTAFPNPGACDGTGSGPVSTKAITSTSSAAAPATTKATTIKTTGKTTTPRSSIPIVAPTHRDTVGGYQLVSCWAEGNGARALSGSSFADDAMTLEKCMDHCSSYVYWGTEYGRECYCGNSLEKSSTAAPLSECNMACGGEPGEFCGAGNRLELYSTTSAPVTPTPTATLSHRPTVAPYTLVGCWAEGDGVRALDQASTTSDKMTNEACATYCKSYKYFGTEYGSECYCGSYLADSSKAAPLDECSMPCSGDQYEYCGAGGRLELYQNPDITAGPPQQPPAVGDFVLVGCQTEGTSTRALSGSSLAQDDMTNEVCADHCKGYEYFGTEYGRECYCGNSLDASSVVAPSKECKMLCAGSTSEYCGGGSRLSVYKKKDAPSGGATRRRRNVARRG